VAAAAQGAQRKLPVLVVLVRSGTCLLRQLLDSLTGGEAEACQRLFCPRSSELALDAGLAAAAMSDRSTGADGNHGRTDIDADGGGNERHPSWREHCPDGCPFAGPTVGITATCLATKGILAVFRIWLLRFSCLIVSCGRTLTTSFTRSMVGRALLRAPLDRFDRYAGAIEGGARLMMVPEAYVGLLPTRSASPVRTRRGQTARAGRYLSFR